MSVFSTAIGRTSQSKRLKYTSSWSQRAGVHSFATNTSETLVTNFRVRTFSFTERTRSWKRGWRMPETAPLAQRSGRTESDTRY